MWGALGCRVIIISLNRIRTRPGQNWDKTRTCSGGRAQSIVLGLWGILLLSQTALTGPLKLGDGIICAAGHSWETIQFLPRRLFGSSTMCGFLKAINYQVQRFWWWEDFVTGEASSVAQCTPKCWECHFHWVSFHVTTFFPSHNNPMT